jgi:dipeptide/tripeptide permease
MQKASVNRSPGAPGPGQVSTHAGGLVSPVLTPWLAARWGWESALGLAALIAVVGAILWMGVRIDAGSVNESGTTR